MVFRIVMICLVLAASYAAFEIVSVWRYYHKIYNPEAAFTVINGGNKTDITIVEFLNYDCLYCRDTHKVLMDYAKTHQDVRLVVRPFPNVGGYSEEAAEMVLAAGMQGKFWDMDEAIIEYQAKPDTRFYRETAGLLDIDYDRMVQDAQGSKVQEMIGDNADTVLLLDVKKVPAILVGKTLHMMDKPLTLPDLISMVAAERAK